MIYCQCEHFKHDGAQPEHWDTERATSEAKLIYGTFFLCEDCDTNCYHDGDRVAPSRPLEVELTKDEKEALIAADHKRIRGMPISVMLVPAQIAALAAAADFIIDNGGFPDNEELTEHLRNALKVLDDDAQSRWTDEPDLDGEPGEGT